MKSFLPFKKSGEIKLPQFLLMGILIAFFIGFLTKAAYNLDMALILKFSGISSTIGFIILIQYFVVSIIEFMNYLNDIAKKKIIKYIKLRKIRITTILFKFYERVDLILNNTKIYKHVCVFRC